MKYKKSLLTIFLIACVLFSISSVMASDTNETTIAIEDDNQIIEETDDEIISASVEEEVLATDNGTFTALQNKINNAVKGSTIYLENDYIWNEDFQSLHSYGGIVIDKSIEIDGNNHKIDALGKSAVFHVDASNVVLKNIYFKNGFDPSFGGGIGWHSLYGNGEIYNCTFMNCSSATYGGGIHIAANLFMDNTFEISNHTISKCTFIDCHSSEGGAINFRSSRDNSVVDCIFINCYSGCGALKLSGENINVTRCNFSDCFSDGNGGEGGAIYYDGLYNGIISECNFRNCYTLYQAGAIWISSNKTVRDCSFIDCSAKDGGGAIYSWGENNIGYCNFTNCSTQRYGGALYLRNNVTVFKCNFISCSANLGGGGIYSSKNTTVNDCSFLKCSSIKGKAIYSYKMKSTAYNSNFTNYSPLDNETFNVVLVGCNMKNVTVDEKPIENNDKPNESQNPPSTNSQGTQTIKKVTPKLTAKKATFKAKTKVKKYTVVLKTNKNKVMKNVKLYLKVNGKTYTAKTNSKGKATFKITKLKKKGTFKATITYKGSSNYNKVTEKIKIKCK